MRTTQGKTIRMHPITSCGNVLHASAIGGPKQNPENLQGKASMSYYASVPLVRTLLDFVIGYQ